MLDALARAELVDALHDALDVATPTSSKGYRPDSCRNTR